MTWFSQSWLGRHWRGDLSLGVSYWFNGVVLTFLFAIVVEGLAGVPEQYDPFWGLVTIVFIWTSVSVLSVWQLVGIWRSASRHKERGGSGFWAILAQVMVVIGVFRSVVPVVTSGVPQIVESMDILLGDEEMGEHSFRVLNAGTEVEVKGGITFGLTEKLEEVVRANPKIRVVHLSSHGGRIGEAIRLRNYIRAAKLDTYVGASCESACTIAFSGGVTRYLHRWTGQLGFHQASIVGLETSEFDETSQEIVDDAVVSGIDRDFMMKAYHTPNSSMWYPTHEEVIKARFATEYSNGQFALSGYEESTATETITKSLLDLPLYVLIKQVDEEAFSAIVDTFAAGMMNGESEKDVLILIKAIVRSVTEKYLYQASDQAIWEGGRYLLNVMSKIDAVDPIACHYYIFPDGEHFTDLRDYLSEEELQRDLEISEMVIASALDLAHAGVGEDEVLPYLEAVFTKLSERFGQDFVEKYQQAENGGVVGEGCRLFIELYREVLTLPKDKAVKTLRYMFEPGVS
ncbi:hypothetical protein [Magnetospira sp. QH-2]|uniref:COG3904 family protein n=1 Tax=Magnetospira sp. (strain QH-2) TaxID=1288970 RepID=UPI0003E818A4|nr:hypothetical protein [Magnetospira sp. QH-2]CCQ73024.1 conserved membrane protein of unknown function [Magnetospira sp. QH-2]